MLRTCLFILLILTVVITPSDSAAQKERNAAAEEEAPAVQVPGLADLLPMASSLYGRLSSLQSTMELPDLSSLERDFAAIDSSLAGPAREIGKIKAKARYRYVKLIEIKGEISILSGELEEDEEPLRRAIRLMGDQRGEWLAEKDKWEEWQSAIERDLDIEQVENTFEEVNGTIEAALSLIHSGLVPMLETQAKAGTVHEKIIVLTGELEMMLTRSLRSDLAESVPPMLTSEFLDQLGSVSGDELRDRAGSVSWPRGRLLARQGWIASILILLALLVVVMIRRNIQKLSASKRWRFLAERPGSAGFFFVSFIALLFYAYSRTPGILKLANIMVMAVTFIRLSSVLVEMAWKREIGAVLMTVLIINSTIDLFGIPFPLFRIYSVLVSIAGFLLCLRWAAKSRRDGALPFPAYLLRLSAAFFAFILIAEVHGSGSLPAYLISSFVKSFTILVLFTVFLYMIHGGIEWLFRRDSSWQVSLLKGVDTESLIRRTTYFIDFTTYGLILIPGILMMWGAYGSLREATSGLLSLGFDIGSKRFSIGLLVMAAAILYGTFFVSWVVRRSLMEILQARYRTERGVRLSIARLAHYLIVFIGFLIIISVLGVDVTKLTIMISALGVGIGFGLQGVVNNFVSGLILLFERPVRVGDFIEIGGKWVEVRQIGIRATKVYTFDETDVIIPNADLIANQVTNWTLSNRVARLIVKVGVVYGSDVEMVMEKLLACAKANEKISGSPPPRVLFQNFGRASLEFELWVYVMAAETRLTVQSELHQEIDRSFREAGIEIAYPQLDLHLRSVDEKAVMRVRGTDGETRDGDR